MGQWIIRFVAGATIAVMSGCGGGDGGSGNESSDPTIPTNSYDDTNTSQETDVAIADTIATPTIIKKTGQTKSYDADGNEVTDGSIKDDGHYQKGTADSYTRDDVKEVVTDKITGLMWQDNSDVSNVTKRWLSLTALNPDGTDDWFDTSGDTAINYCANLTLGGYDDWRLPSFEELKSIVDYDRYSPALSPIFVNFVSDYYWSATTSTNSDILVWEVHFGNGSTYDGLKYMDDEWLYHDLHIRCVRGESF